jgi:putative ABC transport system permease protein
MSLWRSTRSGLRRLFRRDAAERDLHEELQHYLTLATQEYVRRGMSSDAAAREARVRAGSLEAAKSEVRSFGWEGAVNALRQDMRLALRGLRRSPGFTLTAVASLALGIGVLTAMFSIVNAVLFRPLPYRDPGRLAFVWTDDARRGLHREATAFATIADWQASTRAFSGIAYYSTQRVAPMANDPNGQGGRGRSRTALVSSNLFDVLGVTPADGRLLSKADEDGRNPVVVITHGFWQRWFGGAPDTVGRSLVLDDASKGGLGTVTVVGILPPGFYFPDRLTEMFSPATTYWRFGRESTERFPSWARRWTAVGRLAPGQSFTSARADFDRIGRQLTAAYPTTLDDFPGFSATVMPVLDAIAGPQLQSSLWMLLGAIAALLLVVCGNLSTLMLARGSARQHEFALQRALGASRGRVIRQVLSETLVLLAAGGAIGTAVAAQATPLVASLISAYVPRMDDVAFDWRVLLFAVSATSLAGLVFGVLPAIRVSASASTDVLRDGGRGTATPRIRRSQRLLVLVECLLALVLLAGAGLLLKSLFKVDAVKAGFDPSGALAVRLELPSEPPPSAEERLQTSQIAPARAKARERALREAMERVAQIPGAVEVAAVDDLFVAGQGRHSITVPGRAASEVPAGELSEAAVSFSYFSVLHQPLLRGRLPSADDVAQKIRALWSPVTTHLPLSEKERRAVPEPVVVNESFVRRFFPADDPIGRKFCVDPDNKTYWYEIVGVVGDARRGGPERAVIPEYYGPLIPSPGGRLDLIVRTAGDPLALTAPVRAELGRALPQARIGGISTVEEQLFAFTAQRRLQTWLLAAFALLAVVLAGIGIFGLVHYSVAERTREIGIRMALGAAPFDVLRLLLADGLRMPLLGIAAGVAASAALTPLVASQLFEVSATDPATFAGVALTLATVAASACMLAGWRATRANPAGILRHTTH